MRDPAASASLLLLLFAFATPAEPAGGGFSLRFYGNGVDARDLDRVKIPIDAPHRPADVGAADFTVEWWMKAAPGDNPAGPCSSGADNWIYGNILLDRDVFGNGDLGDWGVSLLGGRIAFGVAEGSFGAGICGATAVDDGAWHHVAVSRRASDGRLRVHVDGAVDGTGTGPTGDIRYADGRPTAYPTSDPFLVVGAEKHDAGAAFPSYSGHVDELRLSTTLRYDGPFTPPGAPFAVDPQTAALYHFDEGAGDAIGDASTATGGPSPGVRRFGGSPAGPVWSTDTPFLEPPCAIDTTRVVANDVLTSTESFEACDLVRGGPNLQISSTAVVTFRARHRIELDDELTIDSGATFTAVLDPTTGTP